MPSPQDFALEIVAILRQNVAGRLIDCNDAAARVLGFASREELLVHGQLDYVNESDQELVRAALRDLGTLNNVEVSLRRKDGSLAWVVQNLRLSAGLAEPTIDIAMFDVTEQRIAAQVFEFQIHHDPLTTLPNRSLVVDRMRVALAGSKRRKKPVAILLVDLDHFGLINTAFGQGIADRLLKAVADRLADCVRAEDSIGRVGSDEFVLVLPDVRTDTDAAIVAQRVLDSVARPLVIDGHNIDLRASIGISVAPQDASLRRTRLIEAAGNSISNSLNGSHTVVPA